MVVAGRRCFSGPSDVFTQMTPGSPSSVAIDAPATVGNFGPGFDVISLALDGLGDTLELSRADEDRLAVDGPGADGIPQAWSENTATATLDWLREATGIDARLSLDLTKRMPGGSGLGSSASSAGGAALAFHALFPELGLDRTTLVRAAGAGEAAARAEHFDDVASVVLGGLALVRSTGDELSLQRVQPPEDLHLAVVRPAVELRTEEMRSVLPKSVPVRDAVETMGNLATLVDAFHRGDVETIGACLTDRIAAPYRTERVPFYEEAGAAALEAGAFGVALSGSGPAMVAVTDDLDRARSIADAMAEALAALGVEAEALRAEPERGVMYRDVAMR